MTQYRTPMLILALTLCLMAIGLTMVYSASAFKAGGLKRASLRLTDPEAYENFSEFYDARYLVRQSIFAALGLGLMMFMSAFDHHRLRAMSPWILFLSFGLLCLVLAPKIGVKVNGAYRWIQVGSIRFQPSELAKLAMVVFMARLMVDRQHVLQSFRAGVLPSCAITGLFCFVIVIEPDFGAMVMLASVVFVMWFIAGMRVMHLASLVLMVAPLAVFGVLSSPYRRQRVDDYWRLLVEGPTRDDHVYQSLMAIGSGGAHGLGLGQSLQKFSFLKEAHTDFIFSVMAEEMGFYRSAVVVLLFLLLIILGFRVALRASDSYGGYLASGITLLLAMSVSLNLMVTLGLLPATGLPLPFISYGGSSMLVNCAAMGILINIATYNEEANQAYVRRRRR